MKKIKILFALLFLSLISYGQSNPIRATNGIFVIGDTLYIISADRSDTAREFWYNNDFYRIQTGSDSTLFFNASGVANTNIGGAGGLQYSDTVSLIPTLDKVENTFSLKAGSTSITTLGTIATGIWNATSIDTSKTSGASRVTANAPLSVVIEGKTYKLVTDTSSSDAALATNYKVRTNDSLPTIVAGVWNATAIEAIYGGTGQTSYAVGDLLYASTTTALSKLVDVSAGSYLRSGGVNAAPLWSTLKLPNTSAQGDLLISSSTNTFTSLAKDANATRYLSNQGTSNNPAWSQVSLGNGVFGDLQIANFNSGSGADATTFFRGDGVWATSIQSIPGSQYEILMSDGSGSGVTDSRFIYDPATAFRVGVDAYDIMIEALPSGVVSLGDVDADVNSTTLIIDDAATSITLDAPLIVLPQLSDGIMMVSGTSIVTQLTVPNTYVGIVTGGATLNFPSTLAGQSSDLTISVTGATLGYPVSVGAPNGSVLSNSVYFAWVSATDVVTVRFQNGGALSQDPASGSFIVSVIQ